MFICSKKQLEIFVGVNKYIKFDKLTFEMKVIPTSVT